MDMIGKVRRLHSRDKKSEREIARMTGLSRNTVAKWLDGPVEAPRYRRNAEPTNLTPFHEALKMALKVDGRRPRQARRAAKALFEEVRAFGYEGGYLRLADFVREWRAGKGQGAGRNATPLPQAIWRHIEGMLRQGQRELLTHVDDSLKHGH